MAVVFRGFPINDYRKRCGVTDRKWSSYKLFRSIVNPCFVQPTFKIKGGPEKQDNWLIFKPERDPKTGIILYSGAKVEPEAYSYIGHQLSEQGYLVGMPQMLFNFPILDTNKANEIIDNYSSIFSLVYRGGRWEVFQQQTMSTITTRG